MTARNCIPETIKDSHRNSFLQGLNENFMAPK